MDGDAKCCAATFHISQWLMLLFGVLQNASSLLFWGCVFSRFFSANLLVWCLYVLVCWAFSNSWCNQHFRKTKMFWTNQKDPTASILHTFGVASSCCLTDCKGRDSCSEVIALIYQVLSFLLTMLKGGTKNNNIPYLLSWRPDISQKGQAAYRLVGNWNSTVMFLTECIYPKVVDHDISWRANWAIAAEKMCWIGRT